MVMGEFKKVERSGISMPMILIFMSRCFLFYFHSLVGDGYAKITFNDIVYFNSGNYGQALIYRFGNGCP